MNTKNTTFSKMVIIEKEVKKWIHGGVSGIFGQMVIFTWIDQKKWHFGDQKNVEKRSDIFQNRISD